MTATTHSPTSLPSAPAPLEAPASAPSETLAPTRKKPALWARLLAVLLSTLLSLVLAEVVAGIVRGHAFPFLNLYIADPVLGVRLEPDASTGIRSRTGHVTRIATNAQGFRGPDWEPAPSPAPVAGRVLLLGDSQVFGYGVAEDEALAASLARHLGNGVDGVPREVLNAATPTWGPPEYVQILAELAPIYRPSVVVFVANAANDWSETRTTNARRTTARDGWAKVRVAADGSEDPPTEFPGRRFLLGQSHLVFAVRELFAHSKGAPSVLAASATRLVRDLPYTLKPEPPFRSRISPWLAKAVDVCRANGCKVIAVGLPLDLQVDAREWKKYDETPIDLAPTEALIAAFLADARDHGWPALDLLPVLREASPGAFQEDDYHLSAAGHEALARALSPLVEEALR